MNNQGIANRLRDNWLLIVGMICVASCLRAPLTAVGPVISEIKTGLDIGNSLAGFLTTIPLLIFGIVSPFVGKVVARLSMPRVILYAVILLLIGLLIRVSDGILWFIVGTVIIGIGIAFCNVSLPSYVKWQFPLHIGVVTGIYSGTMNFTAGLGGGMSYPLLTLTDLGYKLSLSFWAILAVLAIIFWMPQLINHKKNAVKKIEEPKSNLRIYRSPLAWSAALMMGFQSMIFYTTIAWVPSILISHQIEPEMAGYYLMLNQFSQVPMTFIAPIVASKMKNQRIIIMMITALFITGFSLLIVGHGWTLLAMIIIGMGAGSAFSVCMMTFTIRAETHQGSIALSGFGQSIGYLVAAFGPVIAGYIYDITRNWTICIIALILMCVCFMLFGLKATQNKVIEDEL